MGVNPKLLRRSPLFADLAPADVNVVADMATTRWFDRGERLFASGDRIGAFYVVIDGSVKLSRATPSGKTMVVDFRGPGQVVGVGVVVGQERHSDDAHAIEDVLTARVPVGDAVDFLKSRPAAVLSLARYLTERLDASEQKIAALATKRVHQRLGGALLDLSDSLGAVVNGVTVINARLTQAELADWIGATRETTSTLLNGLRRAGFIEIVGRRIHMVAPLSIEAYASVENLPDDLSDLPAASHQEPALARSA